MSHKPNVYSLPGTPFVERTVGELVAERPSRSRVFQNFKIDFCCQGARTLREACEGKGVPLSSVVEQLEAEAAEKIPSASNPADLPPAELATYIIDVHHGYLRRELPRLQAMSARVAQVHGGHTPSLIEMDRIFDEMTGELVDHMWKEEQVLFPAVIALSKGLPAPGPLDAPIDCMMHEHAEVGAALERLRELSHGFVAPPEACNTYRALFAGLHEFEEDMHKHIHLENAVLFPTALSLARKE